jgi:hypothetical protein
VKTYWTFWLRCVVPGVMSAFFGAFEPASAGTLSVANNGVDSSSCGWQEPCRSISQAIANASSGDNIYVGPGHYGDVNGDGNFAGPGDEKPDPNAGQFIIPQAAGCIVCVTKPLHIYSLQGAATTVISSVPQAHALYGSTVMIETDGVDFGAPGHGFTISGGGNNGVAIIMTGFPVLNDMSVQGNVDLGDATGFAFYGSPFSLAEVPCAQHPGGGIADCRFTARVLVAGNQAINNQIGIKIETNQCCSFGGGQIIVKDNAALGAGIGFSLTPGGGYGQSKIAYFAGNVQVINNVATNGGSGFVAIFAGEFQYNSALNNSGAGFELTPGGAGFSDNSAIGNGGPGVIIHYEFSVPGSGFPFQVTLNTFTPFASNNFIGNDRNRPAYSFGPSGINPGPSAHCGVLSGIFAPARLLPPYPPPPQMIQLAAAGNYWGSADGPSSTGPGDAVGGACAQLNTSTLATPFAKTPFPVSSNP